MILADTSVWVDHLRRDDSLLAENLDAGNVGIHAFVVGELACGNLKGRTTVLGLLGALPTFPAASDDEVLFFIERHRLMGRGIGLIDAHLLAATAMHGTARLWSRDKRLASIAAQLGLGYTERKH